MLEKKFILKDKDEVETFENMLRDYTTSRVQGSISHISIIDAYNKLQKIENGGRIFAALLDLEINYILLFCDIHNAGAVWNNKFSKGKLEGGSVLDSNDKFFGKMDIHRFFSSYIFRYRALWDKIMGLLILIYSPKEYDNFYSSKKKKNTFKKITEKNPKISSDFIRAIDEKLTVFDDIFRTPEIHGTGSMRKWSFNMEPMTENPSIELIGYWNNVVDMMVTIGKIFEDNDDDAIVSK